MTNDEWTGKRQLKLVNSAQNAYVQLIASVSAAFFHGQARAGRIKPDCISDLFLDSCAIHPTESNRIRLQYEGGWLTHQRTGKMPVPLRILCKILMVKTYRLVKAHH
jgi:hypothetical protein